MKNKSCKNCFFNYRCNSSIVCDNYTPDIKDNEDEVYGAIIEKRRRDYYHEWFEYIDDESKDY